MLSYRRGWESGGTCTLHGQCFSTSLNFRLSLQSASLSPLRDPQCLQHHLPCLDSGPRATAIVAHITSCFRRHRTVRELQTSSTVMTDGPQPPSLRKNTECDRIALPRDLGMRQWHIRLQAHAIIHVDRLRLILVTATCCKPCNDWIGAESHAYITRDVPIWHATWDSREVKVLARRGISRPRSAQDAVHRRTDRRGTGSLRQRHLHLSAVCSLRR